MNKEQALLPDSEYIKELEGFICFLAVCYEKAKETYFDKHMETCSVSNSSRRDLTEAEENEWQRFPMIQGLRLQRTGLYAGWALDVRLLGTKVKLLFKC